MKILSQRLREENYENLKEFYPALYERTGLYRDEAFREEFRRIQDKPQQYARIERDELVGLDCVQAYVCNMSAATTVEEMDSWAGITLPESLLESDETEWTSPKWAKAGDIVFFMHSKTARSSITSLRTQIIRNKAVYTQSEYDRYLKYITHALEIHDKYGGKIFAVGRVSGAPEYVEPEEVINEYNHWRSRYYSAIDNIIPLEEPIDIQQFREYILLSKGGAITPLYDKDFMRLREDISQNNELPPYVMKAVAKPVQLRMINHRNWLQIANDYRRCFILEKQFRRFYVDYLVRAIGDRKRFFTECRCRRKDINDSFMDYVFSFDGHYLPIETKLSVPAEKNIKEQVSKYVYNSEVFCEAHGDKTLDVNNFYPGEVLVVDTEAIYMYDARTNELGKIFDLDELTTMDDIWSVKNKMRSMLGNC